MFSEYTKKTTSNDTEKECEIEALTDKVLQEIDDICDEMLETLYKLPDNFMDLPSDERGEFSDAFKKIMQFTFFQMKAQSAVERVNKILKKKLGK